MHAKQLRLTSVLWQNDFACSIFNNYLLMHVLILIQTFNTDAFELSLQK